MPTVTSSKTASKRLNPKMLALLNRRLKKST